MERLTRDRHISEFVAPGPPADPRHGDGEGTSIHSETLGRGCSMNSSYEHPLKYVDVITPMLMRRRYIHTLSASLE